jgi:hypothetical protein
MIRHFAIAAFAVSLVAAALPMAHAQFADDTQSLFSGDWDDPKTKDDLITFDLGTPEDDEVDISGAQSVEELCCALSEEERRTDGLCVEIECPAPE